MTLRQLYDSSVVKPEKSVVITFDDSYENLYTTAFPIMQEVGFKGTIFIPTGYVGRLNNWDVNLGGLKFRHLSWDQIKELHRNGFEMGSHTIHHPDLTRIGQKQIEREVRDSKAELEDQLGEEIKFISFPFGRYNREVVLLCKKFGFQRGCGFWIRKGPLFRSFIVERKSVYLFDTLWNIRAKLGMNRYGRFEEIKLRVINFFSHGTSMVKPNPYRSVDK